MNNFICYTMETAKIKSYECCILFIEQASDILFNDKVNTIIISFFITCSVVNNITIKQTILS